MAYTQKQFIDEIRFGRHYRVLSFCMTKLNETKKDVLRHLILIQVYLLAVSPSLLATMIALKDDRITERNRTLAYFKDNSILRYRDFVEDIGHKYVVQEHEIKKSMEELPFD